MQNEILFMCIVQSDRIWSLLNLSIIDFEKEKFEII